MSESGTSHRKFMTIAIEEAKQALAEGEVPVGRCIVMDRIIARAHNMRKDIRIQRPMPRCSSSGRPRQGWADGGFRIARSTSRWSPVPCAPGPWCKRGWALVFGAFDDKAGAVGSLYDIPRDFRLNHFVEVVPIMSEETSELMKGFFTGRR